MLFIECDIDGPGCVDTGSIFSFSTSFFDEECIEVNYNVESNDILQTISIHPFPNPSFEELNINFEGSKSKDNQFKLSIHNSLGQSINLGEFEKSELINKTIDISTYKKGLYYILIESKNEYAISKFIIED